MTELRALPISLPPMSRETIGSYLHRLADANHITSIAMTQLLDLNRRYRRADDDPAHGKKSAGGGAVVLSGAELTEVSHAVTLRWSLANFVSADAGVDSVFVDEGSRRGQVPVRRVGSPTSGAVR